MFSDYKKFYVSNANNIKGWKNLTRSELCNKYLESIEKGNGEADFYLSAIICKFWNVATHMYYSQQKKIATEDDCYNVLIDGITYCLNRHVWTDENNSLYGDPNGPEKAINVRLYSLKINFFVAAKRDKRVIDYNKLSLEEISEEASDSFFLRYEDNEGTPKFIKEKITNFFNKKDYLPAFVIDAIAELDFLDRVEDEITKYTMLEFNFKKLKHHLRFMNEEYGRVFAARYGLDCDKVLKSMHYVTDLSYDRMDRRTKAVLKDLSRDNLFIDYLKGV